MDVGWSMKKLKSITIGLCLVLQLVACGCSQTEQAATARTKCNEISLVLDKELIYPRSNSGEEFEKSENGYCFYNYKSDKTEIGIIVDELSNEVVVVKLISQFNEFSYSSVFTSILHFADIETRVKKDDGSETDLINEYLQIATDGTLIQNGYWITIRGENLSRTQLLLKKHNAQIDFN